MINQKMFLGTELNKFLRIDLPSLLGTLRAGKKEFLGSGLKMRLDCLSVYGVSNDRARF